MFYCDVLTWSPGHDPGYKQPLQYTCSQNYSCYPQCQLPQLSTNQSYQDAALSPGVLVSHLRRVSVSCLGVTDHVTCNSSTLKVPDCKPSEFLSHLHIALITGLMTKMHPSFLIFTSWIQYIAQMLIKL